MITLSNIAESNQAARHRSQGRGSLINDKWWQLRAGDFTQIIHVLIQADTPTCECLSGTHGGKPADSGIRVGMLSEMGERGEVYEGGYGGVIAIVTDQEDNEK